MDNHMKCEHKLNRQKCQNTLSTITDLSDTEEDQDGKLTNAQNVKQSVIRPRDLMDTLKLLIKGLSTGATHKLVSTWVPNQRLTNCRQCWRLVMSPWSLKILTPVVSPIPKYRQVLYARIGCDGKLTYCAALGELMRWAWCQGLWQPGWAFKGQKNTTDS